MKQLRLFAASLWLTLATAVFCAIVPAGLPHTNAHGSAFNPANSVVAIQASSGANRAMLRRMAESDPAPAASAGSDIVAPGHRFEIAAPAPAPNAPHAAPLAALTVSQIRIAAYPRGPPLA